MKKVIEFQTKLDNSQFDKDAEALQRKLKEIYAPSDLIRQQTLLNQRLGQMGMPGYGGGGSGQQAFRAAQVQADTRFRQELAKELQALEEKKKKLAEHADQMARTRKAYDDVLRAGKEDLELQKKISAEMKNHADLQKEIESKTRAMASATKSYLDNQPKTPGQQLTESFSKGGASGLLKKGVEMVGGPEALMLMGVAGAAVFALKTAVNVAENFAREFASMRRETSTAQAAAISGSAGNYLGSSVYAGRSVFETGYAGERATALQRALTEDRITRGVEAFRAGQSPNGGYNFGTMLPGGINMGAAQVGFGGLMSMFRGDTQRARFLGGLGFQGYQQKYEALKAQEFVQNYQQNLEAEKAKDPLKQLAMQNYENTYQRDLAVQRRLGLSDSGLYGQNAKGFSSADRYAARQAGFYEDVTNAGFTTEQGINTMGAIMGAGGSTRAGRNASTALRFERGLDLTNASSIFGTLSGNMGDPNRSKNAMIEILAEGTRIGLNKADFVEEQRRFTEAAASFISRGYGGSEADNARMASMFVSGVQRTTPSGISAASAAMEQFNQTSGTATGPEGAIGFAGMLSDPNLSKLSSQDMQALNAMPLNDITSDNPRVIAMAAKSGLSVDKFIDKVNSNKKGKMFRNNVIQSRVEALSNMRNKMGFGGKTNAEIVSLAQGGDKDAQKYVNEYGNVANLVANQQGISGDSKLVEATMGILMGPGGTTDKQSIQDKLKSMGTRTGDVVTQARAADEGMVLEKTRGMLNDFTRMAEVSKSMSADMVNAMLKIQQIVKDIDSVKSEDVKNRLYKTVGEAINTFNTAAESVKPDTAKTQSQTGKR